MASRRLNALIICPPGRYREGLRTLVGGTDRFGQVMVVDSFADALRESSQPPPGLIMADGVEWEIEIAQTIPLIRAAWPATQWMFVIEPGQTSLPDGATTPAIVRGFSLADLTEAIGRLLGDDGHPAE